MQSEEKNQPQKGQQTTLEQSIPSIEEQDKILYRQFLALKGYTKKTQPPTKTSI